MEQTENEQRKGERDNSGKKGKALDKEHEWMTYGHGQQGGMRGGGPRRENWNNYNRITIKMI